MYVKGYTNQPEFFQKFGPPVQLDLKERHRISVALPTADYLDDDHYSDTPIGVSMDDFTLRPIGPGVIMTPAKVIVTPACIKVGMVQRHLHQLPVCDFGRTVMVEGPSFNQ